MVVSREEHEAYKQALLAIGAYQNGPWRRITDITMGLPWLVVLPSILYVGGAIGAKLFGSLLSLVAGAILAVVVAHRRSTLLLTRLHLAAILAAPPDYDDEQSGEPSP